MRILHRESLPLGGFAGLVEHQLVKSPKALGPGANSDGSWPGLGNFVYLADARFMPHGETRMHPHREVDVISVIMEGHISHSGSLGDGQMLSTGDVQVQRAGGEGFIHNEINPDDNWTRMIQLWVLPEEPGQPADYKVYSPKQGELLSIYGGDTSQSKTLASHTQISIATLEADQGIDLEGTTLAYIAQGEGVANGEIVSEGDLLNDEGLTFRAEEASKLILIRELN